MSLPTTPGVNHVIPLAPQTALSRLAPPNVHRGSPLASVLAAQHASACAGCTDRCGHGKYVLTIVKVLFTFQPIRMTMW
eukprot:364634-Chlamydomonas_euryale.AAC.6